MLELVGDLLISCSTTGEGVFLSIDGGSMTSSFTGVSTPLCAVAQYTWGVVKLAPGGSMMSYTSLSLCTLCGVCTLRSGRVAVPVKADASETGPWAYPYYDCLLEGSNTETGV